MIQAQRKTVVVIGNGMVGHRFCQRLTEFDVDRQYKIVTFCEEPRAAYDRVGLTQFFAHRDAEKLMLANIQWYQDKGIDLHIGDRANNIDRDQRLVKSEKGQSIKYDYIVLATGSYPFVPQVPGIQKPGVFVYRTIEDLQQIIAYGAKVKSAAVIGGGLLGLEAAKAAYDLGLETHVVEFASRLMPRQVDEVGSRLLVRKIEELGVKVHLNKGTREVLGEQAVAGLLFNDGGKLDVGMIIVSAGIRPRDELAKQAGLRVHERGGVIVDDQLRTDDSDIRAIGEVALHNGMIYGLVAPGYEMAEIAAANLCGEHRLFCGADLSTKLKLMGIDVASFGNAFPDEKVSQPISYEDPFQGVYKKLLFNRDGSRLIGGMLVGDASDYGTLLIKYKSEKPLTVSPDALLLGDRTGAAGGLDELDDTAQICSCNNVSKSQLCAAIGDGRANTLDELKACTRAGTGCGGCMPLVTDIFKAELAKAGRAVNNFICEHFDFTRQELFEIVKIKQLKTFDQLVAGHGRGNGCEICKPAVASILASLWNDVIIAHATLQDTNDRFLANIQRGGLYSIVPRVAGGEITPDKLIALGTVAKKYGLYSKITGGQRIDLFGAAMHQLPSIWEELIDAGFESGHAYGKALRTVKSCVGTTWCRYGVQDSVGLAVRIENRYRGVRSPHKLKSGVSGCIRECAEAQSKDFGLIATEKGYNLFVCGNGGSNPRHADLLAADLDEATVVRYLDRFIMYYIRTADRLMRTSVWLEKMAGGIDYLRQVIIDDKLGLCDELEKQMQFLVDTYKCEWKEVVIDPAKRKMFQQFVNSDSTESCVEFVTERNQRRPADWAKDGTDLTEITLPGSPTTVAPIAIEAAAPDIKVHTPPIQPESREWVRVGTVFDFPHDGGATVKHGREQIAVFNFASRGQWYACQNLCPHKRELVLSRGIIGDHQGIPKVACPLHKKTYSLEDGACLSGEDYQLRTWPVKVEQGQVYLLLEPNPAADSAVPELMQHNGSCTNGCDHHEPVVALNGAMPH